MHSTMCFAVMYLSDFHFNRFSGPIAASIANEVNAKDPDIVLLGGDYVDTKGGTPHFEYLLHSISEKRRVFAVAGNHDYFFGVKKIKSLVEKHQGVWLEKRSATITLDNHSLQIDGNIINSSSSDAQLRMLCLHKPTDIPPQAYDIIFAGHLHGGQVVLWQTGNNLYPGRLFYKWNRTKVISSNCHFYISRGLGDTLPIRYNCTKEILHVQVESEK